MTENEDEGAIPQGDMGFDLWWIIIIIMIIIIIVIIIVIIILRRRKPDTKEEEKDKPVEKTMVVKGKEEKELAE